jgi:dTDP-4-amino-4,6-dideoxygalactose transaminase
MVEKKQNTPIWKVPLADLDYGEEEDQAVLDVLHSRWLTMGGVTQAFEQEFSEMLSSNPADGKPLRTYAVSNATEALHLACQAVGIGPGDEVIVPSLTFVATANAVLYTGAEVVFADIVSQDDLTIDPNSIASLINERTRAILVMHYAGYPCQMPAILALALGHNLVVIEDAAHAPGAWLERQALGTLGEVGCFSFFSNKNLSTGEGGMLATYQPELGEKIRLMRSHGMTSLTWDRHRGHAYTYDVVELGYNYRIDEIRAALGRVQLQKLEKNNQKRREITHIYWQALQASDVGLPFAWTEAVPGIQPACHIFPLLLPERIARLAFIDRLRDKGIQTSIHYPPIHQFQYYQQRYSNRPVDLPGTESAACREVTLPLYPGMQDWQINLVIESVIEAIR